jgi:cysteine desulfurase family protein (TIGR01976 family)
MLDLDDVRARFPALNVNDDEGKSASAGSTNPIPWAFFDNAGGSVPVQGVIERATEYMRRYGVQLGASYPRSQGAVGAVAAGKAAAASLFGANVDEVVINGSTTANFGLLAQACRGFLRPGDRVVVTDLDHESNIGAWRRLAHDGIEIVEWRFDRESGLLRLQDLEPLLGPKTRLVAFTQCANVVGAIHDVASWAPAIRATGAKVVVDGVAYAPHRFVDFHAMGVDAWACSLYKVYGPHLGFLALRPELLAELRSQNHFFIPPEEGPYHLMPGNVNHELTAALPGVVDYFEHLAAHHGIIGESFRDRLRGVFDRIAAHEEALCEPLLAYLRVRDDVRILGHGSSDAALRVPTVAFTVRGRHAAKIVDAVDRHRVAIRWGHFYAHRAMTALDLHDHGGIVRVSMVHYNTPGEVERLIAALDDALRGTAA